MRNTDIDQTFAAIRQLPPEMDFKSIELLVQQQPRQQSLSDKRQGRLRISKLMILLVLMAATAALLVFKLRTPEKQQFTPVLTDQPLNKLPQPLPVPQKDSAVHVTEKEPPSSSRKSQEILPKQNQVSNVPSVILPNKEDRELLPEEITAEQPGKAINEEPDEQESSAPLRVRTYTSSFCNFEGEDAWINAFVRALIREKIIIDTLNLHFTIGRTFFEVNGKKQSAEMVTKYNELYTSITGVELNSRSSISLSVGESSCSLSKTIDE